MRTRVTAALPPWLRPALSGTALAGAVLVAGSAAVLTMAMVSSFGAVTSLLEQLAPDAGGLFALLLVCLAYVPTAVVWTLAVLVGPGIGIGAVTVTSSSVTTGPLPGFPLLGLVPETVPVWVAPAGVGLLLVAGVLAGRHVARRARQADGSAPPWAPVVAAAVAGVGVTVLVGVACVAAAGSMGPGSLAQVGPPAGTVAAVCGAAVTLSAAASAAVFAWRRRPAPEA